MSSAETEVWGPVDYLVVAVPAGADASAGLAALLGLVERGQLQILDLEVLVAAPEGPSALPEADWSATLGAALAAFDGAYSGLLDDDDRRAAVAELSDGELAIVVLYEVLLIGPVVSAFEQGGARLVDDGPILPDELLAALDATEAAESESEGSE